MEDLFERFASFAGSLVGKLIIFLVVLVIIAGLVRTTFFVHVDNYEAAYRFDRTSGHLDPLFKKTTQNKNGSGWEFTRGYVFRIPVLQSINTIDLRPMQVCINANKRVLNCKLVEFNPAGFEVFVNWHGRQDYSGDDVRQDGKPTTGGLNDILTSYAYDGSGKSYPFLNIMKELKPEEVVQK